jgi:hypothetical protein
MLLVDDRGAQVKIDGRQNPLTQRWKMTEAMLTNRKEFWRLGYDESGVLTHIPSSFWRDRQFILRAVKRRGLSVLEHAPDGLKNSIWRDRQVVLQGVKRRGLSGLEHAPDGLKDIIKVVKVGEWSVLIMTNAVHQRHPDLLQAAREHYFRYHY